MVRQGRAGRGEPVDGLKQEKEMENHMQDMTLIMLISHSNLME